MSNFLPISPEEEQFICNECKEIFLRKDSKKELLDIIVPTLGQIPLETSVIPNIGPKCPKCGSRNTLKVIVYH